MRTSIAALLSLALLGGPRIAAACTGPACSQAHPLKPSALLPSNVQALPFTAATWFAGGADAGTPAPSALIGPKGPVAFTASPIDGGFLLLPQAPLASGTYSLHYDEPCTGKTFDSTVVVDTKDAPIPTTFGTLTPFAQMTTVPFPSGTVCSEYQLASLVDLGVVWAPAMRPWLPIARVQVSIDGQRWSRSEWGSMSPDASSRADAPWAEPLPVDKLATACAGGQQRSVTPGLHTIEVAVEIAGLPIAPPPQQVQVVFACQALPGDEAGLVDDFDAGQPGVPIGDPIGYDSVRSGCTCNSGAPDLGGGVVPALLALGALVRLRRRR